MAQALIQATKNNSASASSLAQAFASNNTLGNLLVAVVAWTGSQTVTVADSLGNTYTNIGQVSSTIGATTINLAFFWVISAYGGANTVTATFSGTTTTPWMAIAEFSGILTAGVISNEGSSYVGYGINQTGGSTSSILKATQSPFSVATGALLLVAATTSGVSATWSLDPAGEAGYSIAVQGNGIVLLYQLNAYNNAPFCQQTAPLPSVKRTSDVSTQWILMTVPFATQAETGIITPQQINLTPLSQIFTYPPPAFQTPNGENVVT